MLQSAQDETDAPAEAQPDSGAEGAPSQPEQQPEQQQGQEGETSPPTQEGTPPPEGSAETPGDAPAEPSSSPGEEPVSALEELVGVDELRTNSLDALAWANEHLFTPSVGIQAVILVAALVPAALFGPQLKKLIAQQVAPRAPYGALRRAASAFANVATPIALYATLQAAVFVLRSMEQETAFVEAGVSLLLAWIVIRMVTMVIRSPFWSNVAFYTVWPIAALDAFGLLNDVIQQLDAFSFTIGENEQGEPTRVSALDGIRTLLVFGLLFWIARFINRFLKGRISTVDELTPSLQALLIKILDVLMPVIAFLIALQIVGFNLATLTIFGGAVGLGIGLGLQRTISNFFAGFTLIADKSIKPGDVIEVEDTFGWVTQMNARYVSVRTRDGTAHLVPNDKFIEEGVINWSHSDRVVRMHAPFGVSYATKDLRAVKKMAEETAVTVDRVLKTPSPMCNVMEFGDSSVNFDLRFWINDPANGTANVRSQVMLAIWDRLHEMGVEIPFPQRDLHIKSMPDKMAAFVEEAPMPATKKRDAAVAADAPVEDPEKAPVEARSDDRENPRANGAGDNKNNA